jgi:hypothetical protein
MAAVPERRVHTRGKRLLRFEFTLDGGSVRALSSNVSAGGAFLCATELPRPGSEVAVRFAAGSDARRYVTIRALVLRTVGEPSTAEPNRGFAVRWLEASAPGHPDLLEEFLKQFKDDPGGQILVPDDRDPDGRYRYLFPPPTPETPAERQGRSAIALGAGPVEAPPAQTLTLEEFLATVDEYSDDDEDDGPPTTPVGAPPDALAELFAEDVLEPAGDDLGAELDDLGLPISDGPRPSAALQPRPPSREPRPEPGRAGLRAASGAPARVEPTVRRPPLAPTAAPGVVTSAPPPPPPPAPAAAPGRPVTGPWSAAAPGRPVSGPWPAATPERPPSGAWPAATPERTPSGPWPATARPGETAEGHEPNDEDIGSGLVPFETPVILEWSGQAVGARTTHLTETQLRLMVSGETPPVYGRVAVLFPSGRKGKAECTLRANVTRVRKSAMGDGGLVTLRLAMQNEPSDLKAYRKIVKKAGG